MDSYGRVDIVICNAGIINDGLFKNMTKEQWNEVIDTNLNGTFKMIKSVWDLMREQASGKIITIGSSTALYGNPG